MATSAGHRWLRPLANVACSILVALLVGGYGAYWLATSHPTVPPIPDPAIIEALRATQSRLAAQQTKEQAIDGLLAQWDRLKSATVIAGRGASNAADREAISGHIRQEMQAVQQSADTLTFAQGEGIIIKTAPNTFRITFPVVMRVVPHVIPRSLPTGITDAKTIEASPIGATIIYAPMTVPVAIKDVSLLFSADF